MANKADIARINTSKLDPTTNLPVIHAQIPITSDDDVEEFGEVDAYQALGVTALPYPPTDEGRAEAVILRDCGGADGVIIGARDDRCAEVYANLKPGDSVLHSVDPDAKSQVRCHASRQVALVTEDSKKQTCAILLDGKNDKVQIAAFGGMIEMSEENGIVLTVPGGGCSIVMKGDTISLVGKVILGGTVPALNLASGTQANIIAVPPVLLAAPNVYVAAV